MWIRAVWGLAGSLAIAGLSLARGALSRSGAAAALVIGTALAVGAGGGGYAALGAFFITSTLLGHVGRARKAATKLEFEKGDTRDAWQALANGGVAAAAALGSLVAPSPSWSAAWLGALATANADTWATELGVLSRAEPISLVRRRRVPRGTSGAVSPLGLWATAAGAATVGLAAALGGGAPVARVVALATVAGTIGSLADSVLGAGMQAGYWCDACGRETESPRHHCGAATRLVRGRRWLDNDGVNTIATIVGAVVAVVIERSAMRWFS